MMWRETGRTAKFVIVDARAALPIVLFAVDASWFNLGLIVFSFVFFTVLAQFGYTFPNAMRRLRVIMLFGKRRPAVPFWRRQKWR